MVWLFKLKWNGDEQTVLNYCKLETNKRKIKQTTEVTIASGCKKRENTNILNVYES